ncbi:MAG: flagellar basal body P-ring formation chaperone FlgA [Nannocystaceae bacterium]|nr:flagellar basal body P-ring formation chaperone FlgA [Nannocystaceae bacterium]
MSRLAASLLALALGMVAPSAGATVRATAARAIVVDADRIVLGDLSPTLPRDVLGVDLGPAPAPGRKTTIARSAVIEALRRAGADPTLASSLPARQDVRRQAERIEAEALTAEVTAAVLAELPLGVDVAHVAGLEAIMVPPGGHTVEIAMGRLRRATTVTVHVTVGTRRWSTQQATVTLTGVAKTPVLRETLPPGTTVTDDHVELRDVGLDDLPDGAITRTDQLVGKRLRSRQQQAAPLRRSVTEAPPVITRGSVVDMIASRPGITVTRQVVAQQDGAPGQSIRVKPVDDDSRTLVVTVDAAGTVHLAGRGGAR